MARRLPLNVPPECFPAYWGHMLLAFIAKSTQRYTLSIRDPDEVAGRRWRGLPKRSKTDIADTVALLLTMKAVDIRATKEYTKILRTERLRAARE